MQKRIRAPVPSINHAVTNAVNSGTTVPFEHLNGGVVHHIEQAHFPLPLRNYHKS
ncbi:unnamed protein product [Lupinus luteus]|uniref:Uncharacterized protein n=1 Tax=Lupinus luteus TaxID=3873 RepID=A0AAV1VT64_LUPLU